MSKEQYNEARKKLKIYRKKNALFCNIPIPPNSRYKYNFWGESLDRADKKHEERCCCCCCGCCGCCNSYVVLSPLLIFLSVALINPDSIENNENIDYTSVKVVQQIILVGIYIYCLLFVVYMIMLWYYVFKPVLTDKYLQSKIDFNRSFKNKARVFRFLLSCAVAHILGATPMVLYLPFFLNKSKFWIDHSGSQLRYFGNASDESDLNNTFQRYNEEYTLMTYLVEIIYTMRRDLKKRGYKFISISLLKYIINMFLKQNYSGNYNNKDIEIKFEEKSDMCDSMNHDHGDSRSKSAFYQNTNYLQVNLSTNLKQLLTLVQQKDYFNKNEECARYNFFKILVKLGETFYPICQIFLSILFWLMIGYVSCFIKGGGWIFLLVLGSMVYFGLAVSGAFYVWWAHGLYGNTYILELYMLLLSFDPSIREYKDINLHQASFEKESDHYNIDTVKRKWYISFVNTFALNDQLHEYLKRCDENGCEPLNCNQFENIINKNVDLGSKYNHITREICEIILDYLPVFIIDDKIIATLLEIE